MNLLAIINPRDERTVDEVIRPFIADGYRAAIVIKSGQPFIEFRKK